MSLFSTLTRVVLAIGLQIADIYGRLGDITDNKADQERALQVLRDEIDLYKQYVLYFQSLTPAKFATLTRTDLILSRCGASMFTLS